MHVERERHLPRGHCARRSVRPAHRRYRRRPRHRRSSCSPTGDCISSTSISRWGTSWTSSPSKGAPGRSDLVPLTSGVHLGPYEIFSLLGAGGMGEVYRGRDPRLGRDVAIKVLPANASSDPGRLQRFEQEARAAAALNHPNILAVYDVGVYDGAPYIVSELLEGQTLRDATEQRTHPGTHRARLRRTDRTRPGRRSREGHRPSRPEAGQRVRDAGRAREDPRLRAGEVDRPGEHWRRLQRAADIATRNESRSRARHDRIYVAGAGARRASSIAAPTSSRSASSSTRC